MRTVVRVFACEILMAGRLKRVISAADFEQLRHHLSKRWEPRNVELAHRLLVLNEKPSAISKATGASPQQVTRIGNAMWKVYEEHMQAMMIPPDWVEVTVCLPPEVAAGVKQLGENALKQLREQLDQYLGKT